MKCSCRVLIYILLKYWTLCIALLSPRNGVGGDIVMRPFVCGWVSGWLGACLRACIRPSVALLVNAIQTEPFQLGLSNSVHILLMTTQDNTYWFSRSEVKGQGHTLHIVVKPCKQDTDWTVSAQTVKLGTHTVFRVKGQGHTLDIVFKPF